MKMFSLTLKTPKHADPSIFVGVVTYVVKENRVLTISTESDGSFVYNASDWSYFSVIEEEE